MITHQFGAALVAERRATLLAEVRAARCADQAQCRQQQKTGDRSPRRALRRWVAKEAAR
jgi:hypothetical protein